MMWSQLCTWPQVVIVLLALLPGAGCSQDTPPHHGAVTDVAESHDTTCTGDAQTTWTSWSIATLRTLRVDPQGWVGPDSFFQFDAAECAKLGIVACRREDSCLGSMYICFNKNAESVEYFAPSQGGTIPCSKSQFVEWLAAESKDCTRQIEPDEIPSAMTALMSSVSDRSTLCCNDSKTRIRLTTPDSTLQFVYWPGLCGGQKLDVSAWTLCGSPGNADIWNKALPFLNCSWYSASSTDSNIWLEFAMRTDCDRKCVALMAPIAANPELDLPAFVNSLAADFQGCPTDGQPP
jgi:hypothetical protein